jgi:hypothetical protein
MSSDRHPAMSAATSKSKTINQDVPWIQWAPRPRTTILKSNERPLQESGKFSKQQRRGEEIKAY